MHQIIFIDGYSGIGKTTLAKQLWKHYQSTYIEQYMIPEFLTKDGTTKITGKDEDETLYSSMVALIKNFCKLGYKNIIALDFNEMRMRDIPEDFCGYDFLILRLVCDENQNITQMQNRGKGLVDIQMLKKCYRRNSLFPRPHLPNEHIIDVTNKTPNQVFEIAKNIINTAKSELNYTYQKPDKKYFGTWVLADQDDI